MISKSKCFLVATFTIILAYYFNKSSSQYSNASTDIYHLVIGILSSRENFLQRQLIRDTWLNVSQPSLKYNYKSWFILGETGCDIPVECRLDRYSCKEWNINASGITEHFHSNIQVPNNKISSKALNVFHQGFSFQVNHPVVVTELGISIELLVPNETVSILLRDLQNKDIVVQTIITLSNESRAIKNGYLYKNVENYFLPKGYEGLLVVEGHLLHGSYSTTKWINGSGIISFNRIYVSQNDFESIKFTEQFHVAPSIGFSILYLNELKNITLDCEYRTPEQKKHSLEISEKLIAENNKWNDLIFVDVMDTYRSLPKKLLMFYKWLMNTENFHAVLKTDDDCIIDIEKILIKLKDVQQFNPRKNWIWSRFRFGWPVNYIGKWAEYEYKSPSYPMFPCGGGYILSKTVVQWLSNNVAYLYPYQGEDVSLGIWMTAINPQYINDENWQCDKECSEHSFNRAQLIATEMLDSWSAKNNCGNICHCHIT